MKILYAIQGTGNGHLSRARDIIPILKENHEVDLLISGTQADVELPYDIKYRFKGLGFIFGSNGGIDLIATYKKNHIKTLLSEINSLPVRDYDLVVNDFEPVSAWASRIHNVKCISVSHQAAVLNKKAPQPREIDIIGKAILKNYAPSNAKYGFHFAAYNDNIFTPVIRSQIRKQIVKKLGHYTVYLPAYDDKRLLKVLKLIPDMQWQVFSKHSKKLMGEKNVTIQPIDNDAFVASMASCEGVLCGAGFETPAEALFMKKKLMVIPMKGQYEQQCNAAALKKMGVPVLKSLKPENISKIDAWIKEGDVIEVDYPDFTEEIINRLIALHADAEPVVQKAEVEMYSVKKFRNLVLKKIVAQL
jgi:uncharacterized protein (TIGR00661 family)